LEKALHREQAKLLQRAFSEAGEAGEAAVSGWLHVNQALGQNRHNAPSEG
jgi:hypothetical protein